jgi:hypothetical protein
VTVSSRGKEYRMLRDRRLGRRRALQAAAILVAALMNTSAWAGACPAQIPGVQRQLDAAIVAHAKAGAFGREGVTATLGLQPTPQSLARADARLDRWMGGERAVALLHQARIADERGDATACSRALAAARRALSEAE